MGRFLRRGLVIVLAAALLAGAGAYGLYRHVTEPGTPGSLARVAIQPGQTGKSIGATLARSGLVKHRVLFRLAIRLDGTYAPLRHGNYDVPMGLSPMEVLQILYDGPNVVLPPAQQPPAVVVTIPEGLSITQVAALFGDADAFFDAAHDAALIEGLGVEAPSLEGFLMPNTYFFDPAFNEADAVERMVGQFHDEYDRLLDEESVEGDVDILEVVTVASLVEEEARIDEERGIIAAVIYNRLKKGMRLEMDSTIQYALGKYGQRLLYEDKEVDSPYNTYKIVGLPPGPISNPGVESLRAALKPADVNFLYFVSNADGKTHTFSRTMREHTDAVRRYRKEVSKQRRAVKARESD